MAQKTCEPLSIWSTLTPALDLAHHNFTIAMHIGIALFKDVAVPAPQDMTIFENVVWSLDSLPHPLDSRCQVWANRYPVFYTKH
jgi:hypothetical protein